MHQAAIFDRTGSYRYSLLRTWDAIAPRLAFVMLNPSTADAQSNDPTIRRCIRFAQTWGYGTLEVVNLFALRATQPIALKQVAEPVGEDCDRYLLEAVRTADCTVLAWGNWGKLYGRDRAVLALLAQLAAQRSGLCCLGLTQARQPRHPLYLKTTTQPIAYSL